MRLSRLRHLRAWAPAAASLASAAWGQIPAILPSEHVVELPPYIVEDAKKGRPWLYARMADLEILSHCDESETEALARQTFRAEQRLEAVLPPDFRMKSSRLRTFLVVGPEMKSTIPDAIMEVAKKEASETRFSYPPNMNLSDWDSYLCFFLVSSRGMLESSLGLEPNFVHQIISASAPAPPQWFSQGFALFFGDLRYYAHDGPAFFDSRNRMGGTPDIKANLMEAPSRWISDSETEALKNDPDYPRWLLPMDEIFGAAPPSDPARLQVWRDESALFLRWAFDGSRPERKNELWDFVRRASVDPPTEEDFRKCFGFGYSDMFERLCDNLSDAVNQSTKIVLGETPEMPAFAIRPATGTEIARIKGDWDRLEVRYITSNFPNLKPSYLSLARTTLHQAYDLGSRDPDLLAVMGLLECDYGDPGAAEGLLEQAVNAGVVRPRAYYELARLRYIQARKGIPTGGRLTPEQVQGVVVPLVEGRRQDPPYADAYSLLEDVWIHSGDYTGPEQAASAGDAGRLFPSNPRVLSGAAVLDYENGARDEARVLLSRAVEWSPDGAFKQRLEALEGRLGGK